MNNLDEIDQFLERKNMSKFTQEKINNLMGILLNKLNQ